MAWSDDEIEIIRRGYRHGVPSGVIASRLKKTDVAIRGMANRLRLKQRGVQGPKGGRPQHPKTSADPLTPTEIACIQVMFGEFNMSTFQISGRINRSVDQIIDLVNGRSLRRRAAAREIKRRHVAKPEGWMCRVEGCAEIRMVPHLECYKCKKRQMPEHDPSYAPIVETDRWLW